MAINIFSGARRTALLMGGLWTLGCAVFIGNAAPHAVLTYEIATLGAVPKLVGASCNFGVDAVQYVYPKLPQGGAPVSVTLCFRASRADDGRMLIPYTRAADGRIWMSETFTSPVTTYTLAASQSLQLDALGIAAATDQLSEKRQANFRKAAGAVLIGLVVGWLIVFTIGWIVRGFMGVPIGKDSRSVSSDTTA